jgi:hypothetical protein
MIQLRHVPDPLHRRLKARAAMAGMSLSEYLIAQLRPIAERPTPEELRERVKARRPVHTDIRAADLIRAERDAR